MSFNLSGKILRAAIEPRFALKTFQHRLHVLCVVNYVERRLFGWALGAVDSDSGDSDVVLDEFVVHEFLPDQRTLVYILCTDLNDVITANVGDVSTLPAFFCRMCVRGVAIERCHDKVQHVVAVRAEFDSAWHFTLGDWKWRSIKGTIFRITSRRLQP